MLVRNYGDAGGDAGRWNNKKTGYQRFHDLARDAAHRKNGGAASPPQVRTPEAIKMEGGRPPRAGMRRSFDRPSLTEVY